MRMMIAKLLVALSIILPLAPGSLVSCAPTIPRACTQIGCSDGLTVQVAGTTPQTFTVEAIAPGVEPRIAQSPGGQSGSSQFFFEDSTPEEVTIRITWNGGSVTETFRPSYETVRPNGPNCPPECQQGRVLITVKE